MCCCIKSINEVRGFRLNDKQAEKSLDKKYQQYDGYKCCKIYILNPHKEIGEEINIVLIFDKNYKIANKLDNCMEGIESHAYREFRRNYLYINTLILWK